MLKTEVRVLRTESFVVKRHAESLNSTHDYDFKGGESVDQNVVPVENSPNFFPTALTKKFVINFFSNI